MMNDSHVALTDRNRSEGKQSLHTLRKVNIEIFML